MRMINHSSKRVMLNVVHAVDMVIRELETSHATGGHGGGHRDQPHDHEISAAAHALLTSSDAPDGHIPQNVRALLRTIQAEARSGYQLCESQLLHVNIVAGTYAPVLETTTISGLYDELGLTYRRRISTDAESHHPVICADRKAIRTILFEASQNALQHGKTEGPVEIRSQIEREASFRWRPGHAANTAVGQAASPKTRLSPSAAPEAPCPTNGGSSRASLRIYVRNEPGVNHSRLLAMLGVDSDLIHARISPRVLQQSGTGSATSSFCGLSDLLLCATAIGASVRLLLRADHVEFQFSCDVELLPSEEDDEQPANGPSSAPRGATPPASPRSRATSPPTLPPSLVFICADDDMVARLVAESFLGTVSADAARSRVLGERYEEVRGLSGEVGKLCKEFGDERVVVQLDQYMQYDEGTLLGTDISRELREQVGFRGVIVIVSANDDDESAEAYRAAGADVASGKTLKCINALPEQLAIAHCRRFPQAAAGAPQHDVVEESNRFGLRRNRSYETP